MTGSPARPARGNPALALRFLSALETNGSFADEEWEELMRRRDELSDEELRAILHTLGGAGGPTARARRGRWHGS